VIKLLLKPDGATEPIEVALQRTDAKDRECYNVVSGEHYADVELETLGPGAGWLRLHGRVIPFQAVRRDNSMHIWIGGRTHEFELVDRTARRAKSSATATQRADLSAPMPGTILKINVQPGDAFEAHAALVVMESMKMEMTLSAPHAGRVKDVLCHTGQLVDMGAVLVAFHEDGHGGAA